MIAVRIADPIRIRFTNVPLLLRSWIWVPLGAGGMAEVYLVNHPRLPRRWTMPMIEACCIGTLGPQTFCSHILTPESDGSCWPTLGWRGTRRRPVRHPGPVGPARQC